MRNYSVTIRMGAAHWDANVQGTAFDFREMKTPERKQWYGAFMSSVRRYLRGAGTGPARRSKSGARRRSRNRGRGGAR